MPSIFEEIDSNIMKSLAKVVKIWKESLIIS